MSSDTRTSPKISDYCSAAGWIGSGRRRKPVLPWIGVRYFAIFLACLVSLVGILEVGLWILGQEGRVVSGEWQLENESINAMNRAKVKSRPDDPLWRSDGIPVSGPGKQKQRILVVGDSFTWGDGYLNANDIWWRQLERELRHRGYFGVEVVSIGFPGASTQDELRWLRDMGLLDKLEPDAVILGYVTNDPETKGPDGKPLVKQVGRDVAVPTWKCLDRTLGRIASRLSAQIKQRLARKWESKIVDAYPYSEWEIKILEPPNIDAYRKVVRELGDFVRNSGKPFFVVTLPNAPSREQFEMRYRPIAPIFAAAGLRFYNLLDDFVREYPSGGEILQWGVNPANGHPGPVSTRFYARKVSDILERDFPSALGPRDARQPKLEPSINDWMPPNANLRQVGLREWELVYPPGGAPAPKAPLGKPHVMVAFAEPVAIRRVSVSGSALKSAELYLTVVDPVTRVERKHHVDLGAKVGNSEKWTIEGNDEAANVNTLKLAAELDPAAVETKARTLRLRIDFDDPPVRP